MTKIAIVLGRLGTHGPSFVRLQLAAEMIRRGYEVDFVIGQDPDNLAQNVPEGCKVHILGTQRPRTFIAKLRDYLKDAQPDGVLASSWPFSAASIIAVKLHNRRLPVVVSEHADFRTNIEKSREFTPKDAWLIKFLSRFIYNRATRIVGVSQGVIDGLCEVSGVKKRKTTTIFNPLRPLQNGTEHTPKARIIHGNFGETEEIRLLSVGRLAPQKGYATMIEALSILKDKGRFRLTIVGEGRLRTALEAQIAHLGLEENVLLAGESHSVSEYYQNADLFLLSSSSEGFGNVLVEALSFGLPIVSTDCQSGPSEILEGGKYGVLTPVGDATAFAAGIEQALANPPNPDLQKSRAAFFSIEAATDQYLAALFSKSKPK
ncbi:glycosyltransferase [Pseudogemmobacter sp. W21_MBD1_M6]|uniref:glycosyltransferase n=1 Tax=Pseudogemmobacter sp. W21_MBD1_M6 TaxID=3240271 RepID=UPI003F9CFF59